MVRSSWDSSSSRVRRSLLLADKNPSKQNRPVGRPDTARAHTAAARPSLFLLEARLGGGVGLTVEPPLLLHGPDGGETEDVRRAYFRDKEE